MSDLPFSFIPVHGAVCNYQTLRSRLSGVGVASGHSAFLKEGIPFSKYQSQSYANRIVQLIIQKIKLRNPNPSLPLWIYEFGAGSGLLARNILNALQRNYPDIYRQIYFQISDINENSIRDMNRYPLFMQHSDRVQVVVHDFLNPDIFKNGPPFLIYCSYLYDALNAHRIGIDHTNTYEILTESYLPESADFIDASSGIPIYRNTPDIVQQLGQNQPDWDWHMRYQIANQIRENYIAIPLSESALPSTIKGAITEFAHQYPHLRGAFSLPPAFFRLMSQLTKIEDLSFLCIDVAIQNPYFLSQLSLGSSQLRYGVSIYHSIFWPLAHPLLSSLGFRSTITPRPDGTTAEILIENGPTNLSAPFHTIFDSPFKNLEFNRATRLSKQKIIHIDRQIKGDTRLEFTHLVAMAQWSIKHHLFTIAKRYSQLLRQFAPNFCEVSYLTMAQIARYQNKIISEKKWVKAGLHLFPESENLHTYALALYIRIGEFSTAIQHATILLRWANRDTIPTIMLQIALLYFRTQDPINAHKWLHGLLDLEQSLKTPSQTDAHVFSQVHSLLKRHRIASSR